MGTSSGAYELNHDCANTKLLKSNSHFESDRIHIMFVSVSH